MDMLLVRKWLWGVI